jgi:rhodanese-related sulfurtransferase
MLFFWICILDFVFRIFEKNNRIMDLSQQEWTTQLENDNNAVILDVRTEEEWNEGIIPGALMNDIYKGQGFVCRLEELDKNKNFYVYCKAGGRSAQACNIMNQMGFKNTYNLVGGFMNWAGKVQFLSED